MADPFPPARPEDALIEAVLEAHRKVVDVYEFGRFRLDVRDQQLTRDGIPVRLPPKEFETLRCLAEAGGQLVTKEQLLRRVWAGVHVDPGTIAQRICALRKILGERKHGPGYIATVPRRGYRLNVAR